MKPHAPYGATEWLDEKTRANAGRKLKCPDCGSDEWYKPVTGTYTDGSPRHYRACKMCGFWQEADGTDAYRVWQSVHTCMKKLNPGESFTCDYCGQTMTAGEDRGPYGHSCGKYMLPDEDGYECQTCGEWQGRKETAVAFPLEGST